jgi:hypothetical protein
LAGSSNSKVKSVGQQRRDFLHAVQRLTRLCACLVFGYGLGLEA